MYNTCTCTGNKHCTVAASNKHCTVAEVQVHVYNTQMAQPLANSSWNYGSNRHNHLTGSTPYHGN